MIGFFFSSTRFLSTLVPLFLACLSSLVSICKSPKREVFVLWLVLLRSLALKCILVLLVENYGMVFAAHARGYNTRGFLLFSVLFRVEPDRNVLRFVAFEKDFLPLS